MKLALLRIEHLALPAEVIHETGDVVRNLGAGRDDRCAFAFPARDFAGRAVAENFVELFS